jgi:hypothetical protein
MDTNKMDTNKMDTNKMDKKKNVLSRIYHKVCEKLLNLYIFLWSSLGYEIKTNKTVDSFIITEDDIEILDLTKEVDRDNLIKYLRHHIMYTDDVFHPMYFFDGPLVVRFKYQNETYQICLKQLESKNNEHSVVMKEPKYLSAVVKNSDIEEGICITEKIVELHGPTRNFFNHIPDSVSDFSVILRDHKGKLHTFDMMGNQKIHEIV